MTTHVMDYPLDDFEANFAIYHDLMRCKVHDVLLVFSPYDAFIVEEGGSLASRIVNEYHGLNLSHPPRMSRVSSGTEALDLISSKRVDLVITMPQLEDMDCFALGRAVKQLKPELPVVLLSHNLRTVHSRDSADFAGLDGYYLWDHDQDLLVALIKTVEDRWNVRRDTELARVRVLLLVEDSPQYRSFFLPIIYQEVVRQTQAVLNESINEEHRLLRMRARPRIMVAENYEEALAVCDDYGDYLHGVISDTRFPRNGRMDGCAGVMFLRELRRQDPDLPLLLLSAESANRRPALDIPAIFLDKNSDELAGGVHDFFLEHLGFGDFVFRDVAGRELARAESLHGFEKAIAAIPDEILLFHAERNHFSNWIMARSEVALASKLHNLKISDFQSVDGLRDFLVTEIHALRRLRQRGVVAAFSEREFDPEVMDFVTIGRGSMGGKALGLAFMSAHLSGRSVPHGGLEVVIPRTFVVTTDYFDTFVEENDLRRLRRGGVDEEIAAAFLAAPLPGELMKKLAALLARVEFPLSVRSSSVMEDAQSRPYAGLYSTYMLANNAAHLGRRLGQLADAIRLVYASAYYQAPLAFQRVLRQVGKDGMGIIIQELVGTRQGDYFYPAISGVAMSRNFYPYAEMKPDEGVAQIALGFGKTVVEGEQSLRFSPRYPEILPQFSAVDDILKNSQRYFYALKMTDDSGAVRPGDSNLVRREISDAGEEEPVELLSSTYLPEENRIRDSVESGSRVITFARVLKYDKTLPGVLTEMLDCGRRGLGCPVEIEFALNLKSDGRPAGLSFLQVRPHGGDARGEVVPLSEAEEEAAFCRSGQALGHGIIRGINDIVQVIPEGFDPARTREMAALISRINGELLGADRPYLLIGPGRWGSNDPWLGIPVQWQDISGVRVIVELRDANIKVDPSQGSHFFQNITSLGIPYITVSEGRDYLDGMWLAGQPVAGGDELVRHIRLERPMTVKVDGGSGRCVMLG